MKQTFLILKGDPDPFSEYSQGNLVDLDCGDLPMSDEQKLLEMASVLSEVVAHEKGLKKGPAFKLALAEDLSQRLIPRDETELKELAEEREAGDASVGSDIDRIEDDDFTSELGFIENLEQQALYACGGDEV